MSLIFLLACLPPAQRDSWEILALLGNGQLFEARFTKGDTGLLKGQGHLRVNRWIHRTTPMSFHLDTPPSVSLLNDTEANFFTHRFYKENDIWNLQMRSEEFNASVYLRPLASETILEQDDRWTVQVEPHLDAVGWTTAEERSALLQGSAAIFKRGGHSLLQSERYVFIGFDSENYWGAEWSNQISFSWGSIDQVAYRDSDIEVQNHGHSVEIITAVQRVNFYPEKKIGEDNQYKHLSWLEKNLSQPFVSTENRTLFNGYFVLESQSKENTLPGVLIYHGENPPRIRRAKPKK
ncbi:MAG: hypothetical protein VX278_09970 [Myxococcota bacterium]|nr:hypothetical protein [Myxococcota bacterium]